MLGQQSVHRPRAEQMAAQRRRVQQLMIRPGGPWHSRQPSDQRPELEPFRIHGLLSVS